jgi:hypothetical protein
VSTALIYLNKRNNDDHNNHDANLDNNRIAIGMV